MSASQAAGADAPVAVVRDPRFRLHREPDGHPERAERLDAFDQALESFRAHVTPIAPRAAERDELRLAHSASLIDALAETRAGAPGRIDADTYHVGESFDVACLAAGATIDLVDAALRDERPRGFAAVRPPGHHAETDRAMGFCLLNNVAVATRVAQARHGRPRILIFDWDVHHGNGTQHAFESEPDVFYVSTHQFPFYPGTGRFAEAGSGAGVGATLNVPMPGGCGDSEYVGVVDRIVAPAARAFGPDLIVVSCGFDAHEDDPLASMRVTRAGFRAMAMRMRALADELCRGRIVHVLEGGYSLLGLREGAEAVLESLVAPRAETTPPAAPLAAGSTLAALVGRVAQVHAGHIPDLGAL